MKSTAEKLNKLASKRKSEILEKQETEKLNKQKTEEERINSILKKVYSYFESNWLKSAEKSAQDGYTKFQVCLENTHKDNKYYDIASDCRIIIGMHLDELYKILEKEGLSYFDTLCKQIEEQGFKDVKVICKKDSWTSIQLNHCVSYTVCLSANFS